MDNQNFYGNTEITKNNSKIDEYIEQLELKGFAILDEKISNDALFLFRNKIDEVYESQKKKIGEDILINIQEVDMCRAPLLYDMEFLNLVFHPMILSICRKYIGEYIVLNLQNAIINRPNCAHHQSNWHRDIPYQNFMTSKPISVNAFITIDEFSEETGATQFLPYSHHFEHLPSREFISTNKISIEASPGSIILFDSMLFHRAGFNKSKIIRRGINQMYSIPLYKQQYDFPKALSLYKHLFSSEQMQLLGFNSMTPLNDYEWRVMRNERLNKLSNVKIEI